MNQQPKKRAAAIWAWLGRADFIEFNRDVLLICGITLMFLGVDRQFGRGYAEMAMGALLLFLVLARRK